MSLCAAICFLKYLYICHCDNCRDDPDYTAVPGYLRRPMKFERRSKKEHINND